MLDEKTIGNDPSSLFNGNHYPSIYIIYDSQLNRPESVSLASLARQSREISIEHPSVGLAPLAQLYIIRDSQLNRPESVSLASLARQKQFRILATTGNLIRR